MKREVIIYLAGVMIIAPAIIGLLCGGIVTILAILYGGVILLSPAFSNAARRFWRVWHRTNFRIINIL